jgi:hypothetical protein
VKVLAAQMNGLVVARGQKSPAGQNRQLAELLWLMIGLYFPALQLMGLTEAIGQKFPEGQVVQLPWLVPPDAPE